jgi:hypothetical protein
VSDNKQTAAARIAGSLVREMKQIMLNSLVILTWFAVIIPSPTSGVVESIQLNKPNLSGTWTLDLNASTSLEALMNQIGASLLDRKYAASTRLTATLNQTGYILMIGTRGPGFTLNQTLYLDGRIDTGSLILLGATSLNTKAAWSEDNKQLVETHQIKTQQGKDGILIIKRYLMDQGKTLVVVFSLKLNAEIYQSSARQIWRKQSYTIGFESSGPARLPDPEFFGNRRVLRGTCSREAGLVRTERFCCRPILHGSASS